MISSRHSLNRKNNMSKKNYIIATMTIDKTMYRKALEYAAKNDSDRTFSALVRRLIREELSRKEMIDNSKGLTHD